MANGKFKFNILTGEDAADKYTAISPKDPFTFYLLETGVGYLGEKKLFDSTISTIKPIDTINPDNPSNNIPTEAAIVNYVIKAISDRISYEVDGAPGGIDEMEFEWWSPQMTSDNTPSPYVATASILNEQGSGCRIYKAFDGIPQTANGDSAATNASWYAVGDYNWIQLDVGSAIHVKGIKIAPYLCNWGFANPKDITVQISDDGENFSTIFTHEGNYTDDVQLGKYIEYLFSQPVYSRYYRIVCSNNYANYSPCASHIGISDIQFLKAL